MKFKNASDVRDIVGIMRDADISAHSQNRARVDELFEGFPPFTEAEAEENHIKTNISFLEPAGLAQKSRSTWNNAMLKPGRYFTVKLDSGPIHKRDLWASIITKRLTKAMKQGKAALRYIESIRATGAQVILHGIGPKEWTKAKSWCPHEVGIEDLLVPSGTRVNLSNLSHFAIYRQYTPEQLFRMTHGKNVDPGWNMGVVNKALRSIKMDLTRSQDTLQDTLNPEKLIKFYKANSGVMDTDAVPTINVWDFYYQEDNDETGKWFRKMISDDTSYAGDDFLYKPTRPYAGDLSNVLHIQFGDGANVAPFLYHAVRSLGFLLYGICHLQNRLRCRFMDAVFEATLQYFRTNNAEDRARVGQIDLFHLGMIPSGVEMVKGGDRWQVNEALVGAGLAQNRQLMSEHASTFVQDIDQGTQKELTATEVMARLNSANALSAALLSMAYTYANFEHREIARRFCLKDSMDPDITSFRLACLKEGVPVEFLNSERWDIQTERVMGGGNKTLELAQSKALMEVKGQFDPGAQREILRDYALAVQDDPQKAERWVPDDTQSVSPAQHDAQLAVGTLMSGAPLAIRQGMDHISYVEAMLGSMKYIIEDIQHIGKPTPQQIIGLVAIYRHLQGHMTIIAQDDQEKQRLAQYGAILKPMMNMVEAWSQQLDQANEAAQQQEGDGGKIAATVISARSKAQIAEQGAALKEKRKDMAFIQEQRRRNAQLASELQRQNLTTDAEVEALDKKTAGDIKAKRAQVLSRSETEDTTQ